MPSSPSSPSSEATEYPDATYASSDSPAIEEEPTDYNFEVVPKILEAIKTWNPPLLPSENESCRPRIDLTDLFYDRHIDKHLELTHVAFAPSLLPDLCKLWPQRLSELGDRVPGHTRSDGLEMPFDIHETNRLASAQSICTFYSNYAARYAGVVSSVLAHPSLGGWYRLMVWEGDVGHRFGDEKAVQDGYGLRVEQTQWLKPFTQEKLLTSPKEHLHALTTFQRSQSPLGVWIVLPLSAESDRVLRDMKPGSFASEILPSRGFYPQVSTTKTRSLSDANIFSWPEEKKQADIHSDGAPPRRSPRTKLDPSPTKSDSRSLFPVVTVPNRRHYSSAFRKDDSPETILQHGWAKAVEHDATFIVFHSGNYERIGMRHRGSQILYLSEMIDISRCRGPAYGEIQVNLYLAIWYDAAIRLRLNKNLPGSSHTALYQPPIRKSMRLQELSKKENSMRNNEGTRITSDFLISADHRHIMMLSFRDSVRISPAPAVFARRTSALYWGRLPKSRIKSLGKQMRRFESHEYLSVEIFDRVGSGAVGVAHRAHARLLSKSSELQEHDVIVKLAFLPQQKKHLLREYSVYHRLASAGVTGVPIILGLFEDVMTDGPSALVMSYGGKNLFTVYESKSYQDVPQVNVPVELQKKFFETLDRIHKAGVLHRDIRAENLVIGERETVEIIDFDRAIFDPSEEAQESEMEKLQMLFDQKYFGPSLISGSGSITPRASELDSDT